MKIAGMSTNGIRVPLLLLVLSSANIAGAQAKYKIVHAFGAGTDGSQLFGSVVLDQAGNIYGTTFGGGTDLCGTVFELIPQSNGQWTEQRLYNFLCYDFDGYGPRGGVALDPSGNLFGTTYYGGDAFNGTVFELTPGAGGWTETVLHSFDGNDGSGPDAGVTLDSQGNLYGTTLNGGGVGLGVVFEMTNGSSGWTLSVLHNFRAYNPIDGFGPMTGVVLDRSGRVYGTTSEGGATGSGTVYALVPTAGGTWQERSYSCGACGPSVSTGLPATDGASSLYGAATYGGINLCGGGGYPCGSIWQLTRQADGQMEGSTLYSFQSGSTGSLPVGGVVRDKAGNLYGTASQGGSTSQSCPPMGCGVVYELAHQADGSWAYRILHTFDYSDGASPAANLTLDHKGHLFGTTQTGGPNGIGGVVFEITP